MKFLNNKAKEDWQKGYDNNQDAYGKCIYDFASAWAEEMENFIDNGKSIKDIAKSTYSKIDNLPEFGITGFMYGAAISVLSNWWKYGKELREWHNIYTQIGTEGEAANKKGTVLNPALLNIKT